MRNPLRSLVLLAALFSVLLAGLSFLASPAFSQTANPAPTVVLTAAPATPFYSSSEFWSAIIAAIGGLIAIWKNSQASTSKKVNESLVLAIEEATKIPEVAAFEQRIKGKIRETATKAGVQPVLHRLVKDLTEPAESSRP
ncbi:MAG: hypothetical protein V4773_25835 [Verrucomicrobiota bacterium]